MMLIGISKKETVQAISLVKKKKKLLLNMPIILQTFLSYIPEY